MMKLWEFSEGKRFRLLTGELCVVASVDSEKEATCVRLEPDGEWRGPSFAMNREANVLPEYQADPIRVAPTVQSIDPELGEIVCALLAGPYCPVIIKPSLSGPPMMTPEIGGLMDLAKSIRDAMREAS